MEDGITFESRPILDRFLKNPLMPQYAKEFTKLLLKENGFMQGVLIGQIETCIEENQGVKR